MPIMYDYIANLSVHAFYMWTYIKFIEYRNKEFHIKSCIIRMLNSMSAHKVIFIMSFRSALSDMFDRIIRLKRNRFQSSTPSHPRMKYGRRTKKMNN